MADFRGTILTVKGRNLLAKAQIGATLTFTKIKLGDGLWSSDTDPNLLDDLVSPKMDLPIENIRIVGDGTVCLRFVLTNTVLSQGFFMREIGIYAQDPDLGEILYAVAYAGDRADFIPSDGVIKVENVVDIYTVIANAQNVTAVISDTVVFATKRDIDELAETLSNLSSQVNSTITSQIDNLTQQLNDTASTLSNQISTVKPEAGATAPELVYQGKLWVNEDDLLKYFDGSNWKNVKVSFADTVDGFHASQTPAPNVIVPLDVNGILDLSATYVKSSVYSFRRVNLTNATSDYNLQVGEEAIINFTNATSVPLMIATQSGTYYEVHLISSNTGGTSGATDNFNYLSPNNTTYSNAFVCAWLYRSSYGIMSSYTTGSAFGCGWAFSNATFFITNFVQYKNLRGFLDAYGVLQDYPVAVIFSTDWQNTTTSWTSLGTITFPQSTSGYILVRRLV
jgi:uncharacterized protein YfcZ (UPF0381/DUF406 family)